MPYLRSTVSPEFVPKVEKFFTISAVINAKDAIWDATNHRVLTPDDDALTNMLDYNAEFSFVQPTTSTSESTPASAPARPDAAHLANIHANSSTNDSVSTLTTTGERKSTSKETLRAEIASLKTQISELRAGLSQSAPSVPPGSAVPMDTGAGGQPSSGARPA